MFTGAPHRGRWHGGVLVTLTGNIDDPTTKPLTMRFCGPMAVRPQGYTDNSGNRYEPRLVKMSGRKSNGDLLSGGVCDSKCTISLAIGIGRVAGSGTAFDGAYRDPLWGTFASGRWADARAEVFWVNFDTDETKKVFDGRVEDLGNVKPSRELPLTIVDGDIRLEKGLDPHRWAGGDRVGTDTSDRFVESSGSIEGELRPWVTGEALRVHMSSMGSGADAPTNGPLANASRLLIAGPWTRVDFVVENTPTTAPIEHTAWYEDTEGPQRVQGNLIKEKHLDYVNPGGTPMGCIGALRPVATAAWTPPNKRECKVSVYVTKTDVVSIYDHFVFYLFLSSGGDERVGYFKLGTGLPAQETDTWTLALSVLDAAPYNEINCILPGPHWEQLLPDKDMPKPRDFFKEWALAGGCDLSWRYDANGDRSYYLHMRNWHDEDATKIGAADVLENSLGMDLATPRKFYCNKLTMMDADRLSDPDTTEDAPSDFQETNRVEIINSAEIARIIAQNGPSDDGIRERTIRFQWLGFADATDLQSVANLRLTELSDASSPWYRVSLGHEGFDEDLFGLGEAVVMDTDDFPDFGRTAQVREWRVSIDDGGAQTHLHLCTTKSAQAIPGP